MGELHLEILVDRMLREFKVEANIGAHLRFHTGRPSGLVLKVKVNMQDRLEEKVNMVM